MICVHEQEEDGNVDLVSEDGPVIGFKSAMVWLVSMTLVIAILSEYVVGTIEVRSNQLVSSVTLDM